jgi:hypothetical protein
MLFPYKMQQLVCKKAIYTDEDYTSEGDESYEFSLNTAQLLLTYRL